MLFTLPDRGLSWDFLVDVSCRKDIIDDSGLNVTQVLIPTIKGPICESLNFLNGRHNLVLLPYFGAYTTSSRVSVMQLAKWSQCLCRNSVFF